MTKQMSQFRLNFFRPKLMSVRKNFKVVHKELQLLNPEFFSVTYGAGGSTRERTLVCNQ